MKNTAFNPVARWQVPCQIRLDKLNIYLSFNINVGGEDNRQIKLLLTRLRVARRRAPMSGF